MEWPPSALLKGLWVIHMIAANSCSGSTNWHWADASLEGPGGPRRQSRPAGASIFELRSRDPRKTLDLQLRYVGGPEATWIIIARGWRWRVPGVIALQDVMNWINRTDSP